MAIGRFEPMKAVIGKWQDGGISDFSLVLF